MTAARDRRWLVCGVAGPALDADERRLLGELRPGGVILFARNVVEHDQLRELVAALRTLPSQPYVAIDLEGGRVNRLERLIGPLPSASAAARAGLDAVDAVARAAAAACAHFGIGVDLAPVADVARPDGFLGGEARCLGAEPEEVRRAAPAFLDGLAAFGVSGCLKHYPGLGSGEVDSHRELPALGGSVADDVRVFHDVVRSGCAVMVAHAVAPALGERRLPATLSRPVVGRLRAAAAPILADDLEMGALAGFGSMGERAAAALAAGCDQVLVCNAMAARREVAEGVAGATGRDATLASALATAAARTGDFGRGELLDPGWDEARRLAEAARRAAGIPQ